MILYTVMCVNCGECEKRLDYQFGGDLMMYNKERFNADKKKNAMMFIGPV